MMIKSGVEVGTAVRVCTCEHSETLAQNLQCPNYPKFWHGVVLLALSSSISSRQEEDLQRAEQEILSLRSEQADVKLACSSGLFLNLNGPAASQQP